jgi:hypothetical protein
MAKEAQKVVFIREEIAPVPSLDDRIADAFVNTMSAAEISALLREVQETSEAAKAESKAASALALDPRLRPADHADARQKMQDADFRSTRLDRAAEELVGVLEDAKSREAAEAAAAEYQAAKAERDELVKALRDYPILASKIVALLRSMVANNERIGRANARRGKEEPLQPAEMIVRGAGVGQDSWFPGLATGTMLPGFYRGEGSMGFVWARGPVV